jgi:hypothetical protein
MKRDSGRVHRGFRGLALASILGFAAFGCADIRPEPDVEEGGLLESPTHEADSLRRTEEREEQNRGGGGGGGSY